jgi:hypothetical protein
MESDADLLVKVRTLRRRTEQYLEALTGEAPSSRESRGSVAHLHHKIARLEAENKLLKAELEEARQMATALQAVKQAILQGVSVKHLVDDK